MDRSIAEEVRFDPKKYLENNPDVAAAGVDPVEHWLHIGRREEAVGNRPHWRAPLFDDGYYRMAYPDVDAGIAAGKFASAAEHWFLFGRDEVLSGSRPVGQGFDEQGYAGLAIELDDAVSNGSCLSTYDHWLQRGRHDLGIRVAHTAMRERERATPALLTADKIRKWESGGYIVLEGFLSHEHCDRINASVDHAWATEPADRLPVAVDSWHPDFSGRRIRFNEAHSAARNYTYKINDLIFFNDDVRAAALNHRLAGVLRWVLGDDPVAIGSLNFEWGSTQPFHTDTLYMPGRTMDSMTAAWFALEDVTEDAGPLTYFPGSHRIPLFKFSSGAPNVIDAEMGEYNAHQSAHVEALDLRASTFLPKKGDVLIWHERLFHGGSPVTNASKTRKSLVVHYWRREHVHQVQPSAFLMDRELM